MGALLKWIIILGILYYLVSRVFRFFFRTLTGNMPNESSGKNGYGEPTSRQKGRVGDIRVLFRPKKKRQDNSTDQFKGGEYVDYEEVE